MRHAQLLILLTLTIPGFATTALASEVLCINETCIDLGPHTCDADASAEAACGVSCPTITTTSTGTWRHQLGALYDPPEQTGASYVATWTIRTTYELSASGALCVQTSRACRVQVSDGSWFQALSLPPYEAQNGAYKGAIPTAGGYLTCTPQSVSLETYAGPLTIRGEGRTL